MRLKKWLVLALSALLLLAAGCQAVQGVDLNAVLKQSLHTTSYEGSMVYEFDLDLSDDTLAEMATLGDEFTSLVSLFTHVKFELDEIKVKDPLNLSMNGTLTLGDIGIGFALQTTETHFVIELDGAPAPIVVDLTGAGDEFADAALTAEVQAELQKLSLKFLEASSDYLFGNMPNVSDISVQLNAPVKVGGEELSLTKVGVRFDGAELLEWLKAYLTALSEDEEGIRTFFQAFKTFAEESANLFAESGLPVEESPFGEIEEELDYDEAADELIGMLQQASLALAYLEITEPETTAAIFGEDLQVSADLYVDGKLNIRKQDIEVNFRPDPEKLAELEEGHMLSGLEGIRFTYSSEMWNVGGDVEPVAPRTDGGVTVEEMEEWSTVDALRFFAGTDLYELLANRLRVGEQELWLDPEFDEPAPIKTPKGTTLVPLRMVAEYFEADVDYDPETKSFIVRDEATGREIVLTNGGSQAVVNGEAVDWAHPVTIINGAAYVPGRDLMKALGGTITWVDYDGWKVLILKRDVADLIRP
jgi:hypothetical protein